PEQVGQGNDQSRNMKESAQQSMFLFRRRHGHHYSRSPHRGIERSAEIEWTATAASFPRRILPPAPSFPKAEPILIEGKMEPVGIGNESCGTLQTQKTGRLIAAKQQGRRPPGG